MELIGTSWAHLHSSHGSARNVSKDKLVEGFDNVCNVNDVLNQEHYLAAMMWANEDSLKNTNYNEK